MSTTTSDEKINRVLLAEKEARQEVDSCRHKAALIIMNGRERVRRIMNQADERITKVHYIAERIIERKLSDLHINSSLLSKQDEWDKKKYADVDKAIERLIAELIGANHEH